MERPILFSGPMVRAILEGRKTQTRRIMKPQPLWVAEPSIPFKTHDADPKGIISCSYGQPGDRLWVREAWSETDRDDGTPVIAYRAGGCIAIGRDYPLGPDRLLHSIAWPDLPHVEKWRPSIHMPRWASRILLEIVSVRVEQIQSISTDDAIAEGIERTVTGDGWRRYADPKTELAGLPPCQYPRHSYRSLWELINGAMAWDNNPWVWVVEFKRMES